MAVVDRQGRKCDDDQIAQIPLDEEELPCKRQGLTLALL